MSEVDPSQLKPDELFLQGRLQITVARDALSASGLNPDGETMLSTYLDIHTGLTDGVNQQDLMVFLKEGNVQQIKADLIVSLEQVEHRPNAQPSAIEAARGLLELLRPKQV